MRLIRPLSVLLAAGALGGCNLSTKLAKLDDLLTACGAASLDDLASMDTVSDECREALNDFREDGLTSAEARLVSPGSVYDPLADETVIYVHGFDADGHAITDWSTLDVQDNASGGTLVATVASVDADAESLSLGFVTDYSGSMRDEDLVNVSTLYSDLIDALPAGYEGQALQFSDGVDVREDYTDDEAALARALALDASYTRGSTALFDGMGRGSKDLAERRRPAHILVVATDGEENASTRWTQEEVVASVNDDGQEVVLLGALNTDIAQLEALQGDQGVYYYSSDFSEIRDQFGEFLSSINAMQEVRVAGRPEEVALSIGEIHGTVRPR